MCMYSSRHHPVLGRGAPHIVRILVLLSSDGKNFLVKFPLVSRIVWAQKFPRLGVFKLSFPYEILARKFFGKISS